MVQMLCGAEAARGQGYGYERAEDPLVLAVKAAISYSRAGKIEKAQAALDSMGWQVNELKEDVKVDLGPALKAGMKAGSTAKLGYVLTHLVFQAMRQKFHWNLEEDLRHPTRSRARLDAALFYYEEILSHAVKRADAKQKKRRHPEILAAFKDMRSALGGSGLFGVGAREPQVSEFRKQSQRVLKLLWEVFPDFFGKPKKKPEDDDDDGDGDGGDGSGC